MKILKVIIIDILLLNVAMLLRLYSTYISEGEQKMKKRYTCKTLHNKIWALGIIGVGIITMKLTGDATPFVLLFLIGGCVFFEKNNIIG